MSHALSQAKSVKDNAGARSRPAPHRVVQRQAAPNPPAATGCACGGGCPRCGDVNDGETQLIEDEFGVPPIVHEVLNSPGQPLDTATRTLMEPRFGQDFSAVRVHTDARAAESARAIHAHAYTVGNHIAFGSSQYRPSASTGLPLLAHELTHVVQQNGTASPQRMPTVIGPTNDPAEQEADRNATRWETALHLTATAGLAGGAASIQRYGHTESCTNSDLTGVVWPGDHAMRQMVAKCIRVLRASPIDPLVTALFPKYFMTSSPSVSTILEVFDAVQAVITGDEYIYECEHDCEGEAAYVRHRLRYIGVDPNVHLCLNHMSGYATPCNASIILHELTHYASHLDDEDNCGGTCTTGGCPTSLSVSDALDNTYSYANFAYELDSISV